MKYISLDSRSAWDSPVIPDIYVFFFFSRLGSSLPRMTSFARASTVPPGVRAGEEEVRGGTMLSVCLTLCPSFGQEIARAWRRVLHSADVPLCHRAVPRLRPPLGTAEPRAQLARVFQCQWQVAAVTVSHPSFGRASALLGPECV